MYKSDVFAALGSRNIRLVEVAFSGGGDEGGVDSINVVLNDGTRSDVNPYPTYNPETRTHEDGNIEPLDKELIEALGKPVYDEYHTFAGEFYVDGTVVWDVESGNVNMGGQEEDRTWVPFNKKV